MASQLNIPQCTKFQTIDESIQIIQCLSKRVNFTAIPTRCWFQPTFRNPTISITGWEVTPFSQFYHTTNFVNFNGVAHHYVEAEWRPVPVDFEVTEHKLLPTFAARIDNAMNYSVYRNPGLKQDSMEHAEVDWP